MSKLHRDVEDWLTETGLSWSIESGTRHSKITLGGKLVGIFPKAEGRSGKCQRARLNIRAQIRRAAKEQAA